MSNRSLTRHFVEWQKSDAPMVLATVIHTEGSTYSKAGRHILIRTSGEHEGLLSGGCLEGDLAEHARTVFTSGTPLSITYDMRDTADDLWGIGLGCNGMMQILLQRLSADNNWQPFTAIAEAMARTTASTGILVTTSDTDELQPGACFIHDGSGHWQDAGTTLFKALEKQGPSTELPATIAHNTPTGSCTLLHWRIQPWPRILLLGAGPDALPVVQLARILGWEITVADHRLHYIESGQFDAADTLQLVDPAKIIQQLPLELYSAIVVMSHHIDTDRTYLQQLSDNVITRICYIGILGPAARRAKLLSELGISDTDFANRLHGPVGLDIGSDSPETIALSLISEIQSVLSAA
jgi:xanthine dehydrogenase accessory factor